MTNHGLYTDVAWAVPVLFTDEAGDAIDLSGNAFVLQLIDRTGSVAFTFRSSGNASNEGSIDTTLAANGRLSFTATETQHAAVSAGLYRAHLYVDAADDLWQAVGKALIGSPGEAETYLDFESVNDGAAATVSGTVTIRLVTSTAALDGGSANSDFSTGPSLDLGSAT